MMPPSGAYPGQGAQPSRGDAPNPLALPTRRVISRTNHVFLCIFERITPDPYIFAVVLTFLTAILALLFAPKNAPDVLLAGWYKGLFDILAFPFQMVLVLVTGYALSNSKPVRRLLDFLASFATAPRRAVVIIILVVMVTSFLNWGCGLVVAGLLSREIAKRIRIDFGLLVAGC